MRSLGLDVGTKTIGVAVSDPMGWTAQGLTTIRRSNWAKDLAQLQSIVAEYAASQFIVGLPRNMDGSLGPQAQFVEDFVVKLTAAFPAIPVTYIDERLSTKQAKQTMLDSGMRRDKRKAMIDEQAAMVILQTYLDRQRLSKAADEDA